MAISKRIGEAMTRSSWIRKMFEEGEIMRRDGRGPVFDFSLGNPDLDPPPEFIEALRKLVAHPSAGMHKYMPNVGYASTRQAVAKALSEEFGLPFTAEHVVMTVGAGGGMNVLLKSILDPGDEVIVLVPYFVEYLFYVDNHGGKVVKVPTRPEFDIDVEAVAGALSPRTKAVIVNSPNNPTGVVYPAETLARLSDALRAGSKRFGTTIYLVADEPYRKIVFDMPRCPNILDHHDDAIVVTSHSKDLGLPGERIGYVAIHPRATEADRLFGAMAFSNRTLGFVNAPALMQRVVESLQRVTIDVSWYRRKRDRIYEELRRAGYAVVKPQGAFYFFPKAPGGDDVAFCQALVKRRVLAVPGTGFGCPGHFRIAYCVADEVIDGGLAALGCAIREGAG